MSLQRILNGIVHFLIKAVVVVLIIFGIIRFTGNQKNYERVREIEELVESMPPGMSINEARVTQTIDENTMDTDCDGLSDVDEINIYGTDPTKASTAGDLYTDGYKVARGWDPHVSKEYEGEMNFPHNKVKNEIIFIPADPMDMEACANVGDETNSYRNKDFNILGTYTVSYYRGNKLSVNLEKYLSDNKKDDIYIFVLTYGGVTDKKASACDLTYEDNIATFDYNFDGYEHYTVCITKKTGGLFENGQDVIFENTANTDYKKVMGSASVNALMSIVSGNTAADNAATDHTASEIGRELLGTIAEENHGDWFNLQDLIDIDGELLKNDAADGLVCASTHWYLLFNQPEMYYVSTGDEELDKRLKEKIVDAAKKLRAVEMGAPDKGIWKTKVALPTIDDVEEVSKEKMAVLKAIYAARIPENSYTHPAYTLKESFEPMWTSYSSFKEDLLAEEITGTETTFFNMEKETFPFCNFSTPYSPDGTCAGFAYYVANKHNSGTYAKKGTEEVFRKGHEIDNITESSISWDISKNEENATLLDYGVDDFHDFDYSKNFGWFTNLQTRDEATQNFAKMLISGYFKYNRTSTNNVFEKNIPLYTYNEYFNKKTLDDVIKYLDTGKVLMLTLGQYDINFTKRFNEHKSLGESLEGTMHAVNIVGYEYPKDNPGHLYLRIYDNNIPVKYLRAGCNNIIDIWEDENKRFQFSYKPVPDVLWELDLGNAESYGYSSKHYGYIFDIYQDDLTLMYNDAIVWKDYETVK